MSSIYQLPLDVDDAVRKPEDIQKFVSLYQMLVKHIPVQMANDGNLKGPEFASIFQSRGADELQGTTHYIHIGPLELVIRLPITEEAKIEAYIDPPLFRPIFITEAKGSLYEGSKMDLDGYPDIVSGNLEVKYNGVEPGIVLDYDFTSGQTEHKGKVFMPL